MLEYPKGGVKKPKDGKEYWWCKEHRAVKGQWVRYNLEDHGNRTSTSSIIRGSNKPPIGSYSNKNLNLTKHFKDGLLSIKDQIDVRGFLSQFNINDQGNE